MANKKSSGNNKGILILIIALFIIGIIFIINNINNNKYNYTIETIKNEYLYSGKIKVMNTIQNKVSKSILRTLERETIVVLVFDTDVEKVDVLDENIKIIKNSNNVRDIICIPQIKNLEDELIYSTNITKIIDLLESKSKKDFKNDFNNCKNLIKKLEDKEFKISKIWSREAEDIFKKYKNEAIKIKKEIKY